MSDILVPSDRPPVQIRYARGNTICLCPYVVKSKNVYREMRGQGISEKKWDEHYCKKFDEVLRQAHIPMSMLVWFVLTFFTLGLFGWVILLIQKSRTRKAARKLAVVVNELNNEIKQNGCSTVVVQLPLPSIPGVLASIVVLPKSNQDQDQDHSWDDE